MSGLLLLVELVGLDPTHEGGDVRRCMN